MNVTDPRAITFTPDQIRIAFPGGAPPRATQETARNFGRNKLIRYEATRDSASGNGRVYDPDEPAERPIVEGIEQGYKLRGNAVVSGLWGGAHAAAVMSQRSQAAPEAPGARVHIAPEDVSF